MNFIERLKNLDEALFLTLNGVRADWLDRPMYLMTTPLFWAPVFIIIGVLLWRKTRAWRPFILLTGGVVLAVGLADLTSARLFKPGFKRYRPTHHIEIGPQVNTFKRTDGTEYRGGKYGFVSSHAANFFAIATAVFVLLGRRPKHVWLFIWAALVSYTRIYLGVHYPADLLAGGLLGAAMGVLSAVLVLKLAQHHRPISTNR